jgi:hypothetical protein
MSSHDCWGAEALARSLAREGRTADAAIVRDLIDRCAILREALSVETGNHSGNLPGSTTTPLELDEE